MQKKRFLLLTLALLVFTALSAQEEPMRPGPNEANIPSYRMEQHEKWLNMETNFPAKERNMWQIGLHTGIASIGGDVRPQIGYAGGAYVRKALGYVVSLRGYYNRAFAYGIDGTYESGIRYNYGFNAGGDPRVDYYDEATGTGGAYLNYKSSQHFLSGDIMFNLNNIKFHSPNTYFAPYLFLGVGLLGHQSSVDALDANGNMYDFESVAGNTVRERVKYLKGKLDYNFETAGSPDRGAMFNVSGYDVLPAISGGLGMGFRLSQRVEVGLETRFIFTGSDYLDNFAFRSYETGSRSINVATANTDIVNYTMFNVGYNLGKNAEEPTWFVNPVDYTYDYLAYLDKKTDFTDTDGDGVPDIWDDEENTPKGAVVDVNGVTMDSDGDGCPDHEDPEPFSSPQYPIVDCKTQWPEGLKKDEVIELIKENSIDGWFLPMIHFDLDKSKIRTEDVANLDHVGEVMTRYKNIKVDVIGHTDQRASEEYNLKLSQRRSEAAVNYLVDNYGIDRSRFNIRYEGEAKPIIPNAKGEKEYYMNRRVEFKVAD